MMGIARVKREITAQHCPVSGMDRAASRTMGPHHFSWAIEHRCFNPSVTAPKKNRDPHRRWRGRFAVLDPARSIPGAASCLSQAGGNHGSRTAHRRTARRTPEHQRQGRIAADQGRAGGRAGRTGEAGIGGELTGNNEGRSGAASVSLRPSCCPRVADLCDFGKFQCGRGRSARLKLDLPREIKSLSAHRYFTRQAGGPARQVAPKLLIELVGPRDSLICCQPSDQPRQFPHGLQGDETRQ